jgi:hypothetical protein
VRARSAPTSGSSPLNRGPRSAAGPPRGSRHRWSPTPPGHGAAHPATPPLAPCGSVAWLVPPARSTASSSSPWSRPASERPRGGEGELRHVLWRHHLRRHGSPVVCHSRAGYRPAERRGASEHRRGEREGSAVHAVERPRHLPGPPPSKPTSELGWGGARQGRAVTRVVRPPVSPVTRWMRVVSRAAARVIAGRRVARRRASLDVPAPGGPRSRR